MIDYYLIFRESDFWILRLFCKRGFGHCDLIRDDGADNSWIYLFNCKNIEFNQLYWDNIVNKFLIIKIPENIIKKRKRNFFGFKGFSCVLMAKYFLGLNSYAITPYQLYKFILKRG